MRNTSLHLRCLLGAATLMLLSACGPPPGDPPPGSVCDPSPCANGTCQEAESRQWCDCDDGWEGVLCDLPAEDVADPCDPDPCGDNGICTATSRAVSCECASGFTGVLCNLVLEPDDPVVDPVDPCDPDPCGTNGTCAAANGEAFCECDAGFTGIYCDRAALIRGCDEVFCEHGTCVDTDVGGQCECEPDWGGASCDEPAPVFTPPPFALPNGERQCDLSNPCVNGVCAPGDQGPTCGCFPGWTGEYCDVQDLCGELDPCVASECVNTAAGFECICPPNRMGETCEILIDSCDPNPCGHGECRSDFDGYRCDCFAGYTGELCDEIVEGGRRQGGMTAGGICLFPPIDFCVNGDGVCEPNPKENGHSCTCDPGWTGLRCDQEILNPVLRINDCEVDLHASNGWSRNDDGHLVATGGEVEFRVRDELLPPITLPIPHGAELEFDPEARRFTADLEQLPLPVAEFGGAAAAFDRTSVDIAVRRISELDEMLADDVVPLYRDGEFLAIRGGASSFGVSLPSSTSGFGGEQRDVPLAMLGFDPCEPMGFITIGDPTGTAIDSTVSNGSGTSYKEFSTSGFSASGNLTLATGLPLWNGTRDGRIQTFGHVYFSGTLPLPLPKPLDKIVSLQANFILNLDPIGDSPVTPEALGHLIATSSDLNAFTNYRDFALLANGSVRLSLPLPSSLTDALGDELNLDFDGAFARASAALTVLSHDQVYLEFAGRIQTNPFADCEAKRTNPSEKCPLEWLMPNNTNEIAGYFYGELDWGVRLKTTVAFPTETGFSAEVEFKLASDGAGNVTAARLRVAGTLELPKFRLDEIPGLSEIANAYPWMSDGIDFGALYLEFSYDFVKNRFCTKTTKIPGIACSATICADDEGFDVEHLVCQLPKYFYCTSDDQCKSGECEAVATQEQADAAAELCTELCPKTFCSNLQDDCYQACEGSDLPALCTGTCDLNFGICLATPHIVDKFGYLNNCEASCQLYGELDQVKTCHPE